MNIMCFAHSLVSGLILDAYCVRYSQVMPFWIFFATSHPKNFTFTWCFGGFHLWIALNLLKYALFCLYRTYTLPLNNMLWILFVFTFPLPKAGAFDSVATIFCWFGNIPERLFKIIEVSAYEYLSSLQWSWWDYFIIQRSRPIITV